MFSEMRVCARSPQSGHVSLSPRAHSSHSLSSHSLPVPFLRALAVMAEEEEELVGCCRASAVQIDSACWAMALRVSMGWSLKSRLAAQPVWKTCPQRWATQEKRGREEEDDDDEGVVVLSESESD